MQLRELTSVFDPDEINKNLEMMSPVKGNFSKRNRRLSYYFNATSNLAPQMAKIQTAAHLNPTTTMLNSPNRPKLSFKIDRIVLDEPSKSPEGSICLDRDVVTSSHIGQDIEELQSMHNSEIEDDIHSMLNVLRDYTTSQIMLPEPKELISSVKLSSRVSDKNINSENF